MFTTQFNIKHINSKVPIRMFTRELCLLELRGVHVDEFYLKTDIDRLFVSSFVFVVCIDSLQNNHNGDLNVANCLLCSNARRALIILPGISLHLSTQTFQCGGCGKELYHLLLAIS